MYKSSIPVHQPEITKADIKSVSHAISNAEISGQSNIVYQFEKDFAKWQGCKFAISVTSGTAALFLAVKVLNLKKKDEILISSSTNIATALSVYHNNLSIIPVDSNPNTWNMNVKLIEKLITKRTKAIIPVHFLGNPVEMDIIKKISKKHNLKIIEDCAESHGASIENKKLGTFGDLACYSFYSNKVITTGEGGMITTNNKQYYEELRLLKNLYFSKPRFYHKKPAFNFRLGALQASLGLSQLKRINKILKKKTKVFKTYEKYLKNVDGISLQKILNKHVSAYWMIGIFVDKNKFGIDKNELEANLVKFGIETRNFFYPMNKQPFLKTKKFYNSCPISMSLWNNGLYLPSSNNLTLNDIKFICDIITGCKIKKF